MERFALCCKILYDIDLLDKKREIEHLKKIVNIPQVLYKSEDEWFEKKLAMYKVIETEIPPIIIDDPIQYEQTQFLGLCAHQKNEIEQILLVQLNSLTNYKYSEWCSNKVTEIVYGIDASIYTLVDMYKLVNFTASETAEFIVRNIIWQFGDYTHSPCVIEDIPIFKDEIINSRIYNDSSRNHAQAPDFC